MKIALLQCNLTVADFEGNTRKILTAYRLACQQGADLAVASELAIFGYPPLDLLERPECVSAQQAALDNLRDQIGPVALVLGACMPNPGPGKRLHNAAVLVRDGQIKAQWDKALLPSYDVFDETRHFEPGRRPLALFELAGRRVALLVCEDIWGGAELSTGAARYGRDLVAELAQLRPDLLVVPNGSPYYWGKGRHRHALVRSVAQRVRCPVVYVNQVGANTDLVFDGRSFVLDPQGACLGALPPFEEGIALIDLDDPSPANYPFDDGIDQLYAALVLGTRDYARKTGHARAVLGLSGGVDSALTACIATEALGPEHVTGLLMPSPYSSDHSLADARALAANLGIAAVEVPIHNLYDAYGKALSPVIGWHAPGLTPGDATEENVQARIRGNLLMAWANRHPGTLLLTTGNKSELAMGYCTLYGDMAGGLAVLSDVLKTQVYTLADHVNRRGHLIPQRTLDKPPSAELRPDQKDSDSLPPYALLDAVLQAYLEGHRTPKDLVAAGLADRQTVARIVHAVQASEFKRYQIPPGLRVTSKAFGSGRRVPIAARWV